MTGFAGKSLHAIAIKVAAAGLSFLMFLALARAMTQEGFGQFGFAFSLATFLGVLGAMGQRNLVLRFAAVYHADGDRAQTYGVIAYAYRSVLFGTGLLAIGLAAAATLPLLEPYRPLLLATSLLTLLLGLAEFQPHPQRAVGRVVLALLPRDVVLRLGMIALAAWYILVRETQIGATDVTLVMCALLCALIAIQAWLEPYTHPIKLLRAQKSYSQYPLWRGAMWGMWGNAVTTSAGRNVAMVLLGALLPATVLGAFFAALRTSMVLELVLIAINVVAAPLLAQHLSRKDTDAAQKVCTKISWMLGAPTLVVFGVFLFKGDFVLTLFGIGYDVAHLELVILSGGYLVSALAGPTTQVMEMGGYERVYFRMLAITTGLALAALIPATILFGGLGAALCISANLIALNVWAYGFIYRELGLSPGILRLHPAPLTKEPAA